MAYLLPQLLHHSAQRTPHKQAVHYRGAYLTYAQLETQSNQIALKLQEMGVERGDRVGIYLNKSCAAIIAIFGILKTGAAYVPLDPAAPKSRIAFIIQNCHLKAMVSSTEKMTALHNHAPDDLGSLQGLILASNDVSPALAGVFPCVIDWSDVLSAPNGPLTDAGMIEHDLAYILYTSGSTGTPKGVMISHRASLTFVNWAYETFGVRADDRVSNHAPLHFDLSIFDIFATIKAGGTIILVPPSLSVFPRSLADFMAKEAISIWYSVPSALTHLVRHGALERHTLPHLRTILFAGEVFPIKYLRQLMELLPKPRYFNLYGPTETNVCTYYEVPQLDVDVGRTTSLSIGKACANTEILVLNDQNDVVPAGTPGELCVRGPSMMTGYWALATQTAKSCIPLTRHSSLGPEMIYRTGDLVRQEIDGNYTYLGRRDAMIKSNGYRIELGEIETALYSHPEVQEAAVIPIPDDEIGNRIKAFIVTPNGDRLKSTMLASYCATCIPQYMVPHTFEFRDGLPQTSTGKVDKTRLRQELGEV